MIIRQGGAGNSDADIGDITGSDVKPSGVEQRVVKVETMVTRQRDNENRDDEHMCDEKSTVTDSAVGKSGDDDALEWRWNQRR